jgi:ABC-type transporter Mla MlaB component
MFRMNEFHTTDQCVILSLAGTFTSDFVFEAREKLEPFLHQNCTVVLDLAQLRSVDRSGIAFLVWATRTGVRIINAPLYVLTWMKGEALQTSGG